MNPAVAKPYLTFNGARQQLVPFKAIPTAQKAQAYIRVKANRN